MRKKSTPKLKIKNLPRFIIFSLMTLILFIMIIMSVFFLMTKIADIFNAQKQALQTSAAVNLANTSTPKNAASPTVTNPKQESKNSSPHQSNDLLEAKKSRLRSGDTTDIKVVFLTFDDGPSDHTGEVLDILGKYDINATFFTTLHYSETAKTMYQRIVKEGHTLANHTSSHDYGLYNNPQAFYADVDKLDQYQKQITGETESSHVFRFPGGSANANETCALGMVNRGWNYCDWNVSSGDGSSDPPSKDVVAQSVIAGCQSHDVSVVLCHAELKDGTRAALPVIIETLQSQGYTFLPMESDYTYPRQLEV